jgi:hypothetical protein
MRLGNTDGGGGGRCGHNVLVPGEARWGSCLGNSGVKLGFVGYPQLTFQTPARRIGNPSFKFDSGNILPAPPPRLGRIFSEPSPLGSPNNSSTPDLSVPYIGIASRKINGIRPA